MKDTIQSFIGNNENEEELDYEIDENRVDHIGTFTMEPDDLVKAPDAELVVEVSEGQVVERANGVGDLTDDRTFEDYDGIRDRKRQSYVLVAILKPPSAEVLEGDMDERGYLNAGEKKVLMYVDDLAREAIFDVVDDHPGLFVGTKVGASRSYAVHGDGCWEYAVGFSAYFDEYEARSRMLTQSLHSEFSEYNEDASGFVQPSHVIPSVRDADVEPAIGRCPVEGCFCTFFDVDAMREHCYDEHGFWQEEWSEVFE